MKQHLAEARFYLRCFLFHYHWRSHLLRLERYHREFPRHFLDQTLRQAAREMVDALCEYPLPRWMEWLARETAWTLMPMIAPFGRVL